MNVGCSNQKASCTDWLKLLGLHICFAIVYAVIRYNMAPFQMGIFWNKETKSLNGHISLQGMKVLAWLGAQ